MNDRETRRYDMFGRAQTFGKDNTADLAAASHIERAPQREKKPAPGTTPPAPGK